MRGRMFGGGLTRRFAPRGVARFLRRLRPAAPRFEWPELIPHPPGGRVLVLAPHMDDETIGCGGTLVKKVRAGAEVTVVFMTDGRLGDPAVHDPEIGERERLDLQDRLAATRKIEAQRACGILGISKLIYLDERDMELSADRRTVARLEEILGNTRPDLVFLPFLTDRHHDHWETNRVFLEASRRLPRAGDGLLCCGYEIWTPLNPNAMVEIREVLEVKRKALAQFESQLRHNDYVHTALGLNAYRSMTHLHGRSYAEAFYLAALPEYRRLYASMGA